MEFHISLFIIAHCFWAAFPQAAESQTVELVGGTSSTNGLVQVLRGDLDGLPMFVCDQEWSTEKMTAVCKELGFNHALTVDRKMLNFSVYHAGSWIVFDPSCLHDSTEPRFDDDCTFVEDYDDQRHCSLDSFSAVNCSMSTRPVQSTQSPSSDYVTDVRSYTTDNRPWPPEMETVTHIAKGPTSSVNGVRLVGVQPYSGRLLMLHGNVEGGVCSDEEHHWSKANGIVVCRQLGFGALEGITTAGEQYAGSPLDGNLPIFGDVSCKGSEAQLSDCHFSYLGVCELADSVMVTCSGPESSADMDQPTSQTTALTRTTSAVPAASSATHRTTTGVTTSSSLPLGPKHSQGIVIPSRPEIASQLSGEILDLDAVTDLQMASRRLTPEEKLHVSLTGPMFFNIQSRQRSAKPVFPHFCWASTSSKSEEHNTEALKKRSLIINSCEAPHFLAVIRRAGPRRGNRGGFMFGFGVVQLKDFLDSQFWVHCKATVCNSSLNCYPACTKRTRNANFEPSDSSGVPKVLSATAGPFKLDDAGNLLANKAATKSFESLGNKPYHTEKASAAKESKRFVLTPAVVILLIISSLIIFTTAVFITMSLRRRRTASVNIINFVNRNGEPTIAAVPVRRMSKGQIPDKAVYLGTSL